MQFINRIPVIRWFYWLFRMPVWIKRILDVNINNNGLIADLAKKADLLTHKTDLVSGNILALHEKTDLLLYRTENNFLVYADDKIVVKKIRDFYYGIPSEDYKLLLHLVFGNPEPGLDRFLINNIKNGYTFIDVGAHIGLVTLRAASLVGFEGKVYSFEPTPRIFKILNNNIEINGLSNIVKTFQIAVSDKKGKAKFNLCEIYGHNTLFPYEDDGELIEVEIDSLDNILSSNERIDMIKIDAEGAEPLILRGMSNIINNNPEIVIIMEFGPGHFKRTGLDPVSFLKDIRRMGFNIFRINEPSGDVTETTDDYLLSVFSENVVLSKKNILTI